MSKLDRINAYNIMVARTGACFSHSYVDSLDPEVKQCTECGMRVLKAAKKVDSIPTDLRHKQEFLKHFEGGARHWGDELTLEMLAEYASEVACDLIQKAKEEHAEV